KRSLTQALDKRTGELRWQADRTPLIHPKSYYSLDAYSTPIVVERQGKCQLVNHSSFYLCGYDLPSGKEIWHIPTLGGQVVATPVVWNELILAAGGEGKCLVAVKVNEEAGAFQASAVWTATRNVPQVSSPVVYANYLYTITPNGIAVCCEPGSNKVVWKERLGGKCDASLTAADGKIYF